MLRIDSFVPESEEGVVVEPTSFNFEKGLTVLEPEQKSIFDISSFAFSGIKEGFLYIDDLKVDSSLRPLARVLLYRIGIKDFAAISAIFVMPSKIKETIQKRKEISKGLKDLKNIPSESIDDKKQKLASLLDFLNAQGVAYLLIDENNEINSRHHEDIESVLSGKDCTSILLKPSPVVVVEKPIEVEGSKPKSELRKYMDTEAYNFVFCGIFALLEGYTIFGTSCLLGSGSVGLGIALLLLSILDLGMTAYVFASEEQSCIKKEVTKPTYNKIRIIMSVVFVLAFSLGVGLAVIFGINNILFSLGNSWGIGLGLSIGIGVIFLLGAIFPKVPYKLINKIKKLFSKKK